MANAHYLIIHYDLVDQGSEEEVLVLRATLNLMNAIFRPGLLQLGTFERDRQRMQFIFQSSAPAFLLFRLFQMVATPFHLTAGIGYGEMGEDQSAIPSGKMHAQEALEQTRKHRQGIVYNGGWQEDALINMWLNLWQDLKMAQSPMQRALSFPFERHLPLYLADQMTEITWPDRDLNKIEQLKQTVVAANPSLSYPTLNHLIHKPSKWADLLSVVSNEGLFIDHFFKKGYATVLAEMTQTTHQNIGYHFTAGKFARERNLSAAIVWQLLREEAVLVD
ncbi:MAG: hypothetical protein Q4A55_04575 [Aerococcus sp.]|nr:hypothetical protein [Aerococcus sp.]